MERYKISLRLNALPNAKVLNVNMGDGNIQHCVVIPIDDNMVKTDNGDVYAYFVAFPKSKTGGYNQTHSIKYNFCAETYKKMSREEIYAMPFVGAMSPISVTPTFAPVPTASVEATKGFVQTSTDFVQETTPQTDKKYNPISIDELPF